MELDRTAQTPNVAASSISLIIIESARGHVRTMGLTHANRDAISNLFSPIENVVGQTPCRATSSSNIPLKSHHRPTTQYSNDTPKPCQIQGSAISWTKIWRRVEGAVRTGEWTLLLWLISLTRSGRKCRIGWSLKFVFGGTDPATTCVWATYEVAELRHMSLLVLRSLVESLDDLLELYTVPLVAPQ